MLINWTAAELVEKERLKRLLAEARARKKRVKRIDETHFQVKGISERDKKPKIHYVTLVGGMDLDAGATLVCDCEWAQRNPSTHCTDTAVVETYLRRPHKADTERKPKIIFATRY